jgi:hypothetical protein
VRDVSAAAHLVDEAACDPCAGVDAFGQILFEYLAEGNVAGLGASGRRLRDGFGGRIAARRWRMRAIRRR